MTVFDMPKPGAGFEARGGWVVRQLMEEFGLTSEQAAGIVGNLGYESIGFETLQEMQPAVEGSAGGYGWPQWTALRRRLFEAWCVEHGLPMSSDEANYGFLVEELKTTHAYTIVALKKTRSLAAAVWSVGQTYERPGGTTASNLPGYDGRMEWARRALAGAQEKPLMHSPLRLGDKNSNDVRQMQRRLVAKGFDPGPVDGWYGERTEAAFWQWAWTEISR